MVRNATGMSTRAGLNALWQFPDTEGKVRATKTTLKRSNAMLCGVVSKEYLGP